MATPRPPRVSDFPSPPGARECHVWAITGRELEPMPGFVLSLLDSAEQARAARYRDRTAGRLFAASRAAQRILAGRYLGRDPSSVTIDRRCRHCGDERHGRPRIGGADSEPPELDFSVTHSDQVLLLAYVSRGSVGIDAEPADRGLGNGGIVNVALSPAEAALVSAERTADRPAAFHRLWTRKEAVLKLTGHGLAVPLRQIDVTADADPAGLPGITPGMPARHISLTDLRLRTASTGVTAVSPAAARIGTEEHVVAVATTGLAREVVLRSAAPFLRSS